MRALLFAVFATFVFGCSSADGGGDPGGPTEDTGPIDETSNGDSATTEDAVGDSGPSDSGATDTATPDTKPVPGAVYGAKCGEMSADDVEAWEDIAVLRGKAKMGAVDCIDTIQKAARNHSNYMMLNGTLTHDETPGKPGFTGAKFWDRMKAAGFTGPGSAMFEVVHSIGDGHGSILGESGWVNTLYHRIPFVAYRAKGFGFGNAASKWATVNFSSGGSVPSPTAVSTWPADGDTGVWTTFRCASEIPNPLPGQTFAGYPVSLTGGSNLNVTEHAITGPSGEVPHVFFSTTTDSTGLIPKDQVYLIPKNPLAKSTTYTVKASGTVGTAPFSITFSFTTGAK